MLPRIGSQYKRRKSNCRYDSNMAALPQPSFALQNVNTAHILFAHTFSTRPGGAPLVVLWIDHDLAKEHLAPT